MGQPGRVNGRVLFNKSLPRVGIPYLPSPRHATPLSPLPHPQDLRTDASRVACFKGVQLMTSAGPCIVPTQADAPIS